MKETETTCNRHHHPPKFHLPGSGREHRVIAQQFNDRKTVEKFFKAKSLGEKENKHDTHIGVQGEAIGGRSKVKRGNGLASLAIQHTKKVVIKIHPIIAQIRIDIIILIKLPSCLQEAGNHLEDVLIQKINSSTGYEAHHHTRLPPWSR